MSGNSTQALFPAFVTIRPSRFIAAFEVGENRNDVEAFCNVCPAAHLRGAISAVKWRSQARAWTLSSCGSVLPAESWHCGSWLGDGCRMREPGRLTMSKENTSGCPVRKSARTGLPRLRPWVLWAAAGQEAHPVGRNGSVRAVPLPLRLKCRRFSLSRCGGQGYMRCRVKR